MGKASLANLYNPRTRGSSMFRFIVGDVADEIGCLIRSVGPGLARPVHYRFMRLAPGGQSRLA